MAAALALGIAGCAKSGTGVGVVQEAGKTKGDIAFIWDSGSESQAGNIATTLPDGETYRGRFLQFTSDYVAPYSGDYFYGWGPGYDYGWASGWGWGGPYWVTNYSGVVTAALTGDRGTTMRCVFRLEDPASGLSGGGIGRCRTSEGTTIENAIIGEGREILTEHQERRRQQMAERQRRQPPPQPST